jgi:hypothetical protein
LPRLLRVKIELPCSEQASKDTTEFKAIQDNTKIATIAWQKEMTKLYTQAKKLDNNNNKEITCYDLSLLK